MRMWTVLAMAALCAAEARAQAPLLELRIPPESVAPGGALQAKVENTEPKPISTGGGSFDLGGFDQFLGIAANSPNGDAAAAAVIRGSTVRVRMVSPSGLMGMDTDYPILTMTVRVPPTAPPGSRVPLLLADGAVFLDPAGVPYPYSFLVGEATVRAGASITNVTPGSGAVPAGGVVTVEGIGFEPGTDIRISETLVSEVRYISPTRIDVVLAEPTTMHGHVVQARLPDDSRIEYVAYQRTTALGASAHPLLSAVKPAFPQRDFTSAFLRFSAADATGVPGIAVQNLGSAPVALGVTLVTPQGAVGPLGAVLPPNSQAVRSLAELFGPRCGTGCGIRVNASAPLQVMGLAGEVATDSVVPVLPSADASPSVATQVNQPSLAVGAPLVLATTLTAGSVPVLADAYVVLETPTGQLLSLTPGGLQSGLTPLARGLLLSTTATTEVLRTTIPAGTQPGTYRWLAALAVPGTLNLLTPIATTTLTVTP